MIDLSDLNKEIKKLTSEIKDELITWRRHFHINPELSSKEVQTAQFVAEKLKEFGVDVINTNFADTHAVIGLIKGKGEKSIALRADMDALPIQEKTDKSYCSKNNGVMHACGHDAHTAMLLGVAKVICSLKNQLLGNVKLIFQPSEERTDCDGAKKLVECGVLENPKVEAIFGLHMFPELPVGQVGTKLGQMMASSDVFNIIIKGKSTHASRPHLGVDPVVISAQVINSLHHIVSRKVDPLHPAVLTIGKIEGGVAENIIPDEVRMSGTVRTLTHELREQLPKWMEHTLWGITMSYGGSYEFKYHKGTPPVLNSDITTKFAINGMKELLGDENFVELLVPSMGAEDFGEYLTKIDGTFIRIGCRNEKKGIVAPLHSSHFDIDEDALPIGVSVLSYLALKWFINNR